MKRFPVFRQQGGEPEKTEAFSDHMLYSGLHGVKIYFTKVCKVWKYVFLLVCIVSGCAVLHWFYGVYLFIYLFIWLPVKNMQKWYIIIIIIIFEHGINFGWREQVETTSTMPVNHISELKL